MPSLKETKTHIASVKSTLKITSAMKLVASAKLHRAQQAVEGMRPYAGRLAGILAEIPAAENPYTAPREEIHRVALVAFASNSSLCGGFNASALRLTLETVEAYRAEGITKVSVFAVGRKVADALKKVGLTAPALEGITPEGLTHLAEHPSYEGAAALASALMAAYADGTFDRIELIHNHFISTASQKPQRAAFLPADLPAWDEAAADRDDVIVEPDPATAFAALLPQVIRLSLYTALLDSAAAEHAARTIAMQTASDNAEDLLDTLTLEYNKARQQKITAEILDIVGGMAV